MKTTLSFKAQFSRNDQQHVYEVLVKPVKSLSLISFMGENVENLPAISQILNINTKDSLRKDGMVELSQGSYYNKDSIGKDKAEGRLSVWRGFGVTVSVFNKKLYLQVDPCSRVLRDETFLQTLEFERKSISLEEIAFKYKGHPVLRKYGNPKIYKIEEIDYKLTPKCLFLDSSTGKEVSYIDYYR